MTKINPAILSWARETAGFSLAELMPSADVGGRGALVAARIVAMVMGLAARQKDHSV